MSAEHEIAAPGRLARLATVSPWRTASPTGVAWRWLAELAEAWREGMALYVRAGMHRGRWGW
jgi:hypothetical protein